jgi:hypothetical protein
MDFSYLLQFTIVISLILFVLQRAERGKRLAVLLLLLIPLGLMGYWAVYRHAVVEGITAIIIATGLNFLFWFLIGIYNPPRSNDEIQVLGMDD